MNQEESKKEPSVIVIRLDCEELLAELRGHNQLLSSLVAHQDRIKLEAERAKSDEKTASFLRKMADHAAELKVTQSHPEQIAGNESPP